MARRLSATLVLVTIGCAGSPEVGTSAQSAAEESASGIDDDGDAMDTSDVGSDGDGSSAADGASTGDEPASPDVGVNEPPAAMWHVESPDDSARTWLVSPEGDRVFWLGVNTVMRDKTCDGILDWIRRTDPSTAAHVEWARLSSGTSGGESNENPYCFNSVGGFSDTNDFDDTGGDSWMIRAPEDGGAGAPYGVVLTVDARGDDRALRDEQGNVLRGGFAEARIGDPWHPGYAADLQLRVDEDVAPRVGDPRLQMWFLGNEIGLFDRAVDSGPGVRDLRHWLWSQCPERSTIEAPQCAPDALAGWLQARYGTIDALDVAWEAEHADFESIVHGNARPVPYVHDCNLTCREDLQRFVHDELLRRWIALVTTTVRATDPDHLLTTPRMAAASSANYRFWQPQRDVWAEAPDVELPSDSDVVYSPFDLFARDGDAGFDLVAINIYDGSASFEEDWLDQGLRRIHERSGLPIVISEFSVRARVDGWTNRGGAGAFVPSGDDVDDNIQRGAYYRSQIEQLASYPFVLGASWHAWSDRYASADPAHQINMGLVQCDDPARGFEAGQRWPEIDDRIAETNCTIMDRIADLTGL